LVLLGDGGHPANFGERARVAVRGRREKPHEVVLADELWIGIRPLCSS
jgi:hypothetical protein